MTAIALPAELHAIEKLREEELEEAWPIQSVMLAAESLRTSGVPISDGFQLVTEVGGDFLDYFELTDGCFGLYLGMCRAKGRLRRCMRRWRWGHCAGCTGRDFVLRKCCRR
jgi:serine phosphatase RsbU (regulator of sigma subunit)